MVYFAKLAAAALGVAGWAVYSYFWLMVRIQGSMRFNFSDYVNLHWFETWIEPFFLFGILALIVWSLLHQMTRCVPKKGE